MKIPVVVFCALAVTGVVLADPYTESIRQAQRVSAQNDAEQQRIQNQSGAAPSAGGQNAASANPQLQAEVQNISSLQADIIALNAAPDAASASDQRIALLNDFSTAATGTKASAGSIKVLVKDLLTTLAGKKVPADKQTKLAGYLHVIFNSSRLSATQQQTVLDNVQKILTGAGVPADAVTDVITDLKKIADETK
jgi:hypothetical protein